MSPAVIAFENAVMIGLLGTALAITLAMLGVAFGVLADFIINAPGPDDD